MQTLLYGRELLRSELPRKFFVETTAATAIPGHFTKGGKTHCTRCQAVMTPVPATACTCQKPCAYCRNCLEMGKIRKCSALYHLPEPNLFEMKDQKLLAWGGTLSAQQSEGSARLIESVQKNETHLLWAVAGAGKTEMLFEGIAYALQQKKRVCIASPRIDVCLELAPRFKEAFPHTPIALLYGGMEEPYHYTQLVIATTHQLFRFKEAFDVLIIDEIDAFPFRGDESLQIAAAKARKKVSTLIYLSATPSPQMQKEVKAKKLKATILPARYHGYPLPVPKAKRCFHWREKLLKQPLKTTFGKVLNQRIKAKKKFLVFIPNIAWMHRFEQVLRKMYPKVAFEAVSAEDPLRKEKVLKMRENKIQFLLSSTILERGVTFPNIDVFVIGAEDRIFTEAALVQIAGRAGRSPKYPKGEVLFFHSGQSTAMKKAIKQIRKMNQLAKERGLIE
jgi:competence protein ComFA